MADFAGPSFSLGFDLDLDEADSELDFSAKKKGFDDGIDQTARPEVASSSGCAFWSVEDEGEGRFSREALRDDPPEREAPFKRLRRGTPHKSSSPDPSTPHTAVRFPNLDDDIEEFSSQEDCVIRDVLPFRQINSSCSSSKAPLHSQRILTTTSNKRSKTPNIIPTSKASIPTSVEASSNKKVFPRLTISPLKRIHLLDSDSEDLSINEDNSQVNAVNEVNSVKNLNIETPAFDQFCEDHFQSLENQSQSQRWKQHNDSEFLEGFSKLQDNQPPCYQYFFHPDVRIQNIIQRRLPNFTPISSSQQRNPEILDYMGQFGERKECPQSQGAGHETSTRGRLANRKKGKGIRVSDNAGTSSAVPKDAAKRRVSAAGSCGHWFTGDNGRKVYVTKTGQELTGQIAYRQYRKETGKPRKSGKKGSKNSKKKLKK